MRSAAVCMGRFAVLLVIATAFPAEGHNGQVGVIYPLAGIVVDGDLSDWPEGMARFPLRHVDDGDPLKDADDFQGFFRVGYSVEENALYVAVEVEDDSVVVAPIKGEMWNAQDGCEIYLHSPHGERRLPVQFFMRGEERGWYGDGSLDDFAVVARWREDGYQFEWRVDIGRMSRGSFRLNSGTVIGFDVSIWDRDEDGSASWIAWSPKLGKYEDEDLLGDLVLAAVGDGPNRVARVLAGVLEERVATVRDATRTSTSYQMFISGVLFAFFLLHLFLFLFYRRSRENLYYAIFTGVIGAAIFFGLIISVDSSFGFSLFGGQVSRLDQVNLWIISIQMVAVVIGGMAFLYKLFAVTPPRYFRATVMVVNVVWIGLGGLLAYLFIDDAGRIIELIPVYYPYLALFNNGLLLLVLLEVGRLSIQGARRGEGQWIVGLGFALAIVVVGHLIYLGQLDYSLFYGALAFLVSMSIYLAHRVARTSQNLEVQLIQVQELQVRTQEQNRQVQEANRLKSDFLARMSHDLRTPMNAIIGYTRILLRKLRGQIDGRQYHNLENVQVAAGNLLVLINDVLDISKIESGRVEVEVDRVDLGELVTECVTSVKPLVGRGVKLEQQVDRVRPIHTDRDRMRRVVMNLLSNAVKFTEKGRIAVSVQALDGKSEGADIELAVADTGVGIPAEDLPHIFEEFHQVDRVDGSRWEGSGLGLAIVKRSVELLGGRVEVESREGSGTTFRVRVGDYGGGRVTA